MSNAPEFSRLISVARIPPQGLEEVIEAKPEERDALAKRFDFLELKSLRAELTLLPGRLESVAVTGVIQAKLSQTCIVTLEPLTSSLKIDIDMVFMPEGDPSASETDSLEDEVDTYAKGKIDLGEMMAQQLGVHINPYPRKAGATLPKELAPPLETEKKRPFAQLGQIIKNKDKSKD